MSKGHHGQHGHHESYAEKEAHKLEKLYQQNKPLTDELNKIRKEHPGEYNKIFQTMNHHANVDKTLPRVEFFQDTNRELKITVETSNKEHDPVKQRAEQYGLDAKAGKWKQEDASLKTAGKVMGSLAASAVEGTSKALQPVADALQWTNPGAKGIETIIHAAADTAAKKHGT